MINLFLEYYAFRFRSFSFHFCWYFFLLFGIFIFLLNGSEYTREIVKLFPMHIFGIFFCGKWNSFITSLLHWVLRDSWKLLFKIPIISFYFNYTNEIINSCMCCCCVWLFNVLFLINLDLWFNLKKHLFLCFVR